MRLLRSFAVVSIFLLLFTLFGPGVQPISALDGPAFVVTSLGDDGDTEPGNGVCAGAGGVCTLRAAIMEANSNADTNTIQFNIPGTGIRQITLTSSLPAIVNPVILDATTQAECKVPCIELSGASLPAGMHSGLRLHTSDSTIKGFILISFSQFGIDILGDRNTIQANYVGFLPGAVERHANGNGIYVVGSDNLIGGTTAAQRNVISGNNNSGILLGDYGTPSFSGNIIQGNYIGTDETGLAGYWNVVGILVFMPAQDTQIGGTAAGMGNVIASTSQSAIEVYGTGTVIQGNLIGVAADGITELGGGEYGVRIRSGSSNNTIGGTTSIAKNKIAHYTLGGIRVETGASGYHTIRHNSIFSNDGLGIDLGPEGVTVNDSLDPDTGPNGLQNFPGIASATSATKAIVANLRSKANSTYRLEFFKSPACDPSGKGEGKTYLGTVVVRTDATGYVRVSFTSPKSFAAGTGIAATATDSSGKTSEFGGCRVAE